MHVTSVQQSVKYQRGEAEKNGAIGLDYLYFLYSENKGGNGNMMQVLSSVSY